MTTKLLEAANATGINYPALREQIVSQGQAIVPELKALQDEKGAHWKLRVMAGICLEYIQKGDEITSFLRIKWWEEPGLKENPGWKNHMNRPNNFSEVVTSKMCKLKLECFYLEGLWKQAPPKSTFYYESWEWPWLCSLALTQLKNPNLEDVLLDLIGENPDIRNRTTNGYIQQLFDMKSKKHSMSFLRDGCFLGKEIQTHMMRGWK